MSQALAHNKLSALRARIDSIDADIIALLGKRFEATNQVGLMKAKFELSAVDHERENAQRLRYTNLARQYGLSDELVQAIFKTVIAEVVANHQVVAKNSVE
jgi:monofunctional chorismate mutase